MHCGEARSAFTWTLNPSTKRGCIPLILWQAWSVTKKPIVANWSSKRICLFLKMKCCHFCLLQCSANRSSVYIQGYSESSGVIESTWYIYVSSQTDKILCPGAALVRLNDCDCPVWLIYSLWVSPYPSATACRTSLINDTGGQCPISTVDSSVIAWCKQLRDAT